MFLPELPGLYICSSFCTYNCTRLVIVYLSGFTFKSCVIVKQKKVFVILHWCVMVYMYTCSLSWHIITRTTTFHQKKSYSMSLISHPNVWLLIETQISVKIRYIVNLTYVRIVHWRKNLVYEIVFIYNIMSDLEKKIFLMNTWSTHTVTLDNTDKAHENMNVSYFTSYDILSDWIGKLYSWMITLC